ncbi:MAG: hypothetical protein COT16_01810 [Elusimicrobia bacterium CG08_land_8_20_14_0_20_44_26]|nr:MAG: hypothetical protein COT16_01810 [Elusimicrobia bacterium CG08_land_8_20_14_0_20_44_26]
MKILLADNDIDRRFKIKLILRKYECVFYEARNADFAFMIMKKEHPDMCLIDYILTGKEGLSNYDIVSRISVEWSLPAIVLLREGMTVARKFPGIEYITFPETDDDKRNFIETIEKLYGSAMVEKKGNTEIPMRKKLEKILIADDEEAIILLLKVLLRGYEIEAASSGVELIDKALEFKPDLIITDVIMPGMSGWKAVREIRKCEELQSIPVIFASGYVKDKEIYEMHRPQGPSYFILKPFMKKELFEVIKKYFIFES